VDAAPEGVRRTIGVGHPPSFGELGSAELQDDGLRLLAEMAEKWDGELPIQLMPEPALRELAPELSEELAESEETVASLRQQVADLLAIRRGRGDVWALGVILYELLAGPGMTPFQGKTLYQIIARIGNDAPTPLETYRPDLPPPLVAAVMQCFEKRPRSERLAPRGRELDDAPAREGRARPSRGGRRSTPRRACRSASSPADGRPHVRGHHHALSLLRSGCSVRFGGGIARIARPARSGAGPHTLGARIRVDRATGQLVALPPKERRRASDRHRPRRGDRRPRRALRSHCETSDISAAMVDAVKALSGVPLRRWGGFYLLLTNCRAWRTLAPGLGGPGSADASAICS
jgi:hypothetical protein